MHGAVDRRIRPGAQGKECNDGRREGGPPLHSAKRHPHVGERLLEQRRSRSSRPRSLLEFHAAEGDQRRPAGGMADIPRRIFSSVSISTCSRISFSISASARAGAEQRAKAGANFGKQAHGHASATRTRPTAAVNRFHSSTSATSAFWPAGVEAVVSSPHDCSPSSSTRRGSIPSSRGDTAPDTAIPDRSGARRATAAGCAG